MTNMQVGSQMSDLQSQVNDLIESNKQQSKEKKDVEKAAQHEAAGMQKQIDQLQAGNQKKVGGCTWAGCRWLTAIYLART